MTPLVFMLVVYVVSILAGIFGSVLGLGGGLIVIPALTLLLGVDIRYAIGASVVSVIATSSGAGAAYLRNHQVNMKLGMFLELGTTMGALLGAFLAGLVSPHWLYLIFSWVMILTAAMMFFRRGGPERAIQKADKVSDTLSLHGSFVDGQSGVKTDYRVGGTRLGFSVSAIAGVLSGLLGIGGGVLKVPAMHLGMGVPMKVATATSSFMIGVTACASAGVYLVRGDIDPLIAGPTALGVLCGAFLGARLASRMKGSTIKKVFVVAMVIIAIQMFRKGWVTG
jgi:uncharacterized membrane protein YfcA